MSPAIKFFSTYTSMSSFTSSQDHHSNNTRNKEDMDISYCRLSKKKDSLPLLGVSMFNALPENI